MFQQPRYIQNSLSLIFPRREHIRRQANAFEDRLHGKYVQPHIFPMPDNFEPGAPRILFTSQHGCSQIIISQVSISLTVSYTPDWQLDISKGQVYLLERVPILFDLLHTLDTAEHATSSESVRPFYCGLTTLAHLPSMHDQNTVLEYVHALFLKDQFDQTTHDLEIKTTRVIDEHFFSNITVANYRSWKEDQAQEEPRRLPRQNTSEGGIQVIGDFNDRSSFNEDVTYYSSQVHAESIIRFGLHDVQQVIARIEAESK